MVIREDVDIGSVVIGDLHRKSQCTQLRLGEVVDVLVGFRRTQLNLIYCGLGLEKPTDDIADDVPITRTLLGEFTKPIQHVGIHTMKGFVAEVQDDVRFEGLEDMLLRRHMDGLDNVNTQNLSLVQLQKDFEAKPLKSSSSLAPLSPNKLRCMMHAKNPCTPTELHKGLDEGPLFQRTPGLTLSVVPLGSTKEVPTTRRLELPPTLNV